MPGLQRAIELLKRALTDEAHRESILEEFRNMAWVPDEGLPDVTDEAVIDVLFDLATVLDYYSPVSEFPDIYFGEDRLKTEILKGLEKLRALGVDV